MFTIKKFKAFTLAEILITIGIIGIVAALTLPTLIGNYRKSVVENKLKSTYSQLANMLQIVNTENDLSFIPEVDAKSETNGYSYDFSEAVFEKYFVQNLKIAKKLTSDTRFDVCNSEGKGCYKNPSYACYILVNGVGVCAAINSIKGNISFQVIINPQRDVLYSGRDVFGFVVPRDITNNDYSMNIKTISQASLYTSSNRENFIKSCTSEHPFPSYVGNGTTDREYFCTFLIARNNWKVPTDYPIRF